MIRPLLKRSAFYFVGLSLSKALSIIVFILFARVLKAEGFGDLVLYATLGQIATFLGDFGLVQWYQKKAHVEERSLLFSKLIVSRIFTLIMSIILWLTFFTIVPTFSYFVVILFVLTLIPDSFTSVIDGYYFDKKQPLRVAFKKAIWMIVMLLGYFILGDKLRFESSVILYFIGGWTALLWYFPWGELKKIRLKPATAVISTLHSSFPYAFLTLTSYAYARGDSIVVRYGLNSAALGIYGAAYRFLEGLSLIPTAIQHNLFPESAKEGNVSLKQVGKITLLMGIIGSSIAVFLYLYAEILIRLILGEAFIEAVPILQIFSLVVLLFFISSPLNTVILSSKRLNNFVPWGFGNTILNLALNILFVPVYGISAAAWVMFTTELTGLLINLYFVKQVYKSERV